MDFLNKLVKSMGYKTCHHLNSLDASQCADDCKKLENKKFAKTLNLKEDFSSVVSGETKEVAMSADIVAPSQCVQCLQGGRSTQSLMGWKISNLNLRKMF